MPPDHPLPYTALCADLVRPLSPIPSSSNLLDSLPRGRLNLLASDGYHLYHPLNRHELAKYHISRPYTPVPVPLPSISIAPPTTVNNMRISNFPSPQTPTLVMTGGHELSLSPGTLTLLSPASTTAKTQNLSLRSAWGLATHPSGTIALTTNSASGIVLSLDTPPHSQSLKRVSQLLAHADNIPCVHFSPCGNFLASASIDSTYAIYHTHTGRRLHQSEQPSTEWCWAVHWLPTAIAVPVSEADPVWGAISAQRRLSYWEPPEGYSYIPAPREALFHAPDSPSPAGPISPSDLCTPPDIDSPRFRPLYHDGSPVEGQRENETPLKQPRIEPAANVAAYNTRCYALPRTQEDLEPTKAGRQSEDELEYLMIECREETIFLCRVNTSLGAKDDVPPTASVETLDALKIKATRGDRSQAMYTNVIDVPKLNLVIVTGVTTGVILLRILQPKPGTMFELLGNTGMQVSANPVLFVERVITPKIYSIIGTCVVERPSDSLATESFELWILTQDGMFECWDLSRGEIALDLSARF